jgi:uncharacterized protein YukE
MRGKDGRRIEAEIGPELDYLSQVSRRLGVVDLVADYFRPVVGDWNDLHDEAERWRAAGKVAESVTRDLTKPLGRLDSAWQGKSADSFVEHMQKVGLAGHDMSDAMTAMGEALDETAEGIRGIVEDMAVVYKDTADTVSGVAALPLDGDPRVIQHLDELRDPAKELFESVRDVLEAFLKLCDGLSGTDADFAGVKMDHRYPEQNWTFTEPKKAVVGTPGSPGSDGHSTGSAAGSPGDTKPESAAASVGGGGGSVGAGVGGGGSVGGGAALGSASGGAAAPSSPTQPGGFTGIQDQTHPEQGAARPAAAAAGGGGGGGGAPGGAAGGAMMGGAPMGGAGGQQGGDKEHKSKVRIAGSTEDLLGKPKKSAPPVVGQD